MNPLIKEPPLAKDAREGTFDRRFIDSIFHEEGIYESMTQIANLLKRVILTLTFTYHKKHSH